MIIELTDDEAALIGFALACYIEDTEKQIRKHPERKTGLPQLHRIEQLTYTKIIPNSWSGPKPSYWK